MTREAFVTLSVTWQWWHWPWRFNEVVSLGGQRTIKVTSVSVSVGVTPGVTDLAASTTRHRADWGHGSHGTHARMHTCTHKRTHGRKLYQKITNSCPNIRFSSYILLTFWFQKIIFMIKTEGKVVKMTNECSNSCTRRFYVAVVMYVGLVDIFNRYQHYRLTAVSCIILVLTSANLDAQITPTDAWDIRQLWPLLTMSITVKYVDYITSKTLRLLEQTLPHAFTTSTTFP